MNRAAYSARYQDALQAFMALPDEDGRQGAYALGREALEGDLGILELAQVHALSNIALKLGSAKERELLRRSAEFLAECIAPFQLQLSGYREALERNEALLLQAQRVESLGLLVAGIVHDFNNLLGIIQGYTEMSMDDPALSASPDLRQTLVEIGRASERAGNLTRQLLAFSRKQEAEPRLISLNSVLDETSGMLRLLLGPSIELSLQPARDLSPVLADPNQMVQVLMNLAINSKDAMPQGGRLTLSTANVDLDPQGGLAQTLGLSPGRYTKLSISDQGQGMDPATQARIFEPFFTTKGVGHGTGLGLATVHSIIKRCKGGLRVFSAPGLGTTFDLYLPAAEKLAEAKP